MRGSWCKNLGCVQKYAIKNRGMVQKICVYHLFLVTLQRIYREVKIRFLNDCEMSEGIIKFHCVLNGCSAWWKGTERP